MKLEICSDGYPDQFGGKHGKQLMPGQLKKLLLSNHHLLIEEQKGVLKGTYEAWKQGAKLGQIDDVTVVGVRIS
ncbi:MAG TPA: hypothetical protein DCE41_22965 [Cytophagales bacterium]|nr:hypothetical protein [Cytophagales bacterium]HAA22064.1 hypothetical protein [Cytophagales bacterium]HAP60812.1 hypothetical protein [Cytophagales bacterium]